MGESKTDGKSVKPIERIIISCVTFDTVKITDPIEFYDATKAYLVHYFKKENRYELVYQRVLEMLDEKFDLTLMDYDLEKGRCENKVHEDNEKTPVTVSKDGKINKIVKELSIVDVNQVVYDFQEMLKTMFSIMECERKDEDDLKNPIYVNISAGTSEFSAAALIASMMFENVEVFSVNASEYTVSDNSLYSDENGKFIGLAKSVKEPYSIKSFSIPRPDRRLVLSLRIYHENGYPTAAKAIEALKTATYSVDGKIFNLWDWEDTPQEEKFKVQDEKLTAKDKMKFQRQFIDKWMAEDFLIRVGRGSYKLSSHGEFTVETYYTTE